MASTQSISVSPFPPARRSAWPRCRLGPALRSTSSSRPDAAGIATEGMAASAQDSSQDHGCEPTKRGSTMTSQAQSAQTIQAALSTEVGTLSDKFTGMARVMAGQYDWKPGQGVRSVSEVFNLIVME